MPVTKRQHLAHSVARGTPYAQPLQATPESEYFPLRSTIYPPGMPINGVRSRKIFSDFSDQTDYLEKLRAFWENKLADLKADHKYLNKMKEVKQEEIMHVVPLFSRPKESSPSPTQDTVTPQESTPKDSGRLSHMELDDIDMTDLNELDELEAMFKSKYDDDDEEENEEDEDKTREALASLLEQFGDTF